MIVRFYCQCNYTNLIFSFLFYLTSIVLFASCIQYSAPITFNFIHIIPYYFHLSNHFALYTKFCYAVCGVGNDDVEYCCVFVGGFNIFFHGCFCYFRLVIDRIISEWIDLWWFEVILFLFFFFFFFFFYFFWFSGHFSINYCITCYVHFFTINSVRIFWTQIENSC